MESEHCETFCGVFMDQKTTNGPELHLGVPQGGHNPLGPRCAQVGCAHLGGLPHPLFALQIPNIPKTLGVDLDQKFRRHKPL